MLPEIPVIDLTKGGPAQAVAAFPRQTEDLFAQATRRYTPAGVRIGDSVSKRWLAKNGNPYLHEMEAVQDAVGKPGASLLNVSFEWCCTSGVAPSSDGGSVLLRVLDWDLPGLGRNIIVARQAGVAGEWLNLTWPGFSGVITAMAPGRFSAAINQPPMPTVGLGLPIDWAVSRSGVWRSRALPPAHLLRMVFDEAVSYSEAKRILCDTEISTPAFFTLSGTKPDEGCVIERTQADCRVREAPAAVANHWVDMPLRGKPRGRRSHERKAMMDDIISASNTGLEWLAEPILNSDTRLVAAMNAASGILAAEGWEKEGKVTKTLSLVDR